MSADPDYIITAWASPESGPGWSNSPVCVLVVRDGQLHIDYIQPEDQTPAMGALYGVSAAASQAMRRAVEMRQTKQRRQKE